MKKIPENWSERLGEVKHDWGEPEELAYYDGEVKIVRYCETCGAMSWGFGKDDRPQFYSCRVMTNWPGDDAPCRCTLRGYLISHGII